MCLSFVIESLAFRNQTEPLNCYGDLTNERAAAAAAHNGPNREEFAIIKRLMRP